MLGEDRCHRLIPGSPNSRSNRRIKLMWFRPLLALMLALVCSTAPSAAPVPKDKQPEGTKIDSGSFGVFQRGNRVGTETFSIYQTNDGSIINSEFKTDNASSPEIQTSEVVLTRNGEIKGYEGRKGDAG